MMKLEIFAKTFSRPTIEELFQSIAPALNVNDAGGVGLPVIFQHGLCGDAQQTIEAFPSDLRFRRITIEVLF
jgi:hypothetical protein